MSRFQTTPLTFNYEHLLTLFKIYTFTTVFDPGSWSRSRFFNSSLVGAEKVRAPTPWFDLGTAHTTRLELVCERAC